MEEAEFLGGMRKSGGREAEENKQVGILPFFSTARQGEGERAQGSLLLGSAI